jgi:hypothetical protein
MRGPGLRRGEIIMRDALALWSSAAATRVERERRAPTIEERRKAALDLRRSFQRIERDYSEAYEQCRSDTQRRALEEARSHAKAAALRAAHEDLLPDKEGWQRAEADFNAGRAKITRPLATLKTAGAVMRILKRLGMIAEQLAILAA